MIFLGSLPAFFDLLPLLVKELFHKIEFIHENKNSKSPTKIFLK